MNVQNETKVKRVAIVGPECTGKSELSNYLAKYFGTVWVPEFARHYIDRLNRVYTQADLLEIARWQLLTEDELALTADDLLICDTNLLVIKVWSEFKYGSCDPWILEQIKKRNYDLQLLTYVDIPWENDPQREHPGKREELYQIYKHELEQLNVPFVEIRGERDQRSKTAIDAIQKL